MGMKTFHCHDGEYMSMRKKEEVMPMHTTRPPSRSALLIIDMQNDFVQDGAPLMVANAQSVIPAIRNLLTLFRKRSLPVFHIQRIHRPSGVDVEITRQETFRNTPFAVEGTSGAEIIPELTPIDGEYIVKKTRMSAFFQTELDLMLRTLRAERLFVAGIQTPNCIRTTVFDGMALNYQVFLVRDAVAAKNEEIHRANILDMQNIGIRVVGCSDVPGLL